MWSLRGVRMRNKKQDSFYEMIKKFDRFIERLIKEIKRV